MAADLVWHLPRQKQCLYASLKGSTWSLADWVVADSLAPNYFASTLETISGDDQLGLIDPRIHLTAVKPNEKDGPDLHNIFVKVHIC